MCTTAFFAFLRVGEITYCARSPAVLQVKQVVKLEDLSGATVGFKIRFDDFKHSYNQPNISITLLRRSDICPVQSLLDYLVHRRLADGPCSEHWRAALSRVKCFQTFCHQFFKAVGWIPQSIKGTAFVLVLPRSQQAAVFQTYRFALWGVGNPTRFASAFAFLTCVLAVFVVTRHKRLSIWLRS